MSTFLPIAACYRSEYLFTAITEGKARGKFQQYLHE